MDRNIKTKLNEVIKEHIVKRKAMFIPALCVSTFMLVGYAAVDKEKPEIVSNRIELSYGEEFDVDAIDITDNRDSRDLIEVNVNTKSLDNKQLGSYEVEVTATDQFSNVETKKITVDVVDQIGPGFQILGANEGYTIQVPVNGSADFGSYIKAIDNVDGDVTPFIESSSALDTSNIGFQTITLTATDSSQNKSKQTYQFAVVDMEAPVVNLMQGDNVTIDYGSTFNAAEFISINDNLDGAIEPTIEGSIDTTKMDEVQTLKITASDKSGNVVESQLNVVVKDISAPALKISKSKVTIDLGTNVDLKSYIVSATDNKDGDVTAKINVGNVNLSTAGTKTVTYSVSDASGNVATSTLTIVVNEVYTPGDRSGIVGIAASKVGSAYVSGGNGPNAFDCSGFTSWVYRQAGISIPRTSGAQSSGGTYVARSDLQPGDLVFFSATAGGRVSHVGLYIGGGRMIHAATPSSGVCYSSINIMNYVTARRY